MALSGDSVSTNFYSAIKPVADGARCFHRYSLADVQAEQYRAVTHNSVSRCSNGHEDCSVLPSGTPLAFLAANGNAERAIGALTEIKTQCKNLRSPKLNSTSASGKRLFLALSQRPVEAD
jgi:hypothetical protein